MYKEFTASEYRKRLALPDDYIIDGLLSYGAWDDEKHHSRIIKALESLNISFTHRIMNGFLSKVLEINVSDRKYWFTVVYGSALLSEYVHLASLFGSKKNIHIGSCGGLSPNLESCDLIVPTWTYGNESTTRTYDREAKDFKHYSDEALSERIIELVNGKYPLHRGPIITNQAMMGETWDDVKTWSNNGYYAVEMETATVFSVSKHFNVPSASLLYVSDNLVKGQSVGDESHIQQKAVREAVKDDVYRFGLRVLMG